MDFSIPVCDSDVTEPRWLVSRSTARHATSNPRSLYRSNAKCQVPARRTTLVDLVSLLSVDNAVDSQAATVRIESRRSKK
eukprot:1685078-Amphidinium_carterae.1